MGINTNIEDVHHSHKTITFFASKKKMPLNEKKCNVLTINNKPPYVVLILVNGKQMEYSEKIRYLGDIFNSRGNNKDLIQDRIQKGRRCLVNTISECRAVTCGCKEIQTLMSTRHYSSQLSCITVNLGPASQRVRSLNYNSYNRVSSKEYSRSPNPLQMRWCSSNWG